MGFVGKVVKSAAVRGADLCPFLVAILVFRVWSPDLVIVSCFSVLITKILLQ